MKINALFAGKPQPLGPRGSPSSIVKHPVEQLDVSFTGTVQDEQANKKLHGGPEKVLHQYGPAAYSTLQSTYAEGTFHPGTIGENISVEGMEDDNVFVGDQYQMGEVILEVSAPRAPCNKISHRFGIANLDRFVGQQGLTGWYYRVIKQGTLRVGDTVKRLHRPIDSVSIKDLVTCVFSKTPHPHAAGYAQLKPLDDEWREKCAKVAAK